MTNTQRWGIIIGLVVFCGFTYLLAPILTPFLLAALLAYMGDPIVRFLKRHHIPRTLAATIVFLTISLVLAALIILLVPLLVHQIQLFLSYVPAIIEWVQTIVIPWINHSFDVNINFDGKVFTNLASEHWQQAGNVLTTLIRTATQSGLVLVEFAINLVLVPVVTFYLLRDWDRVVVGVRKLLPRSVEPTVTFLVHQCNEVLGAFLRGQLMVMISLGFIYSVGLWLVGLKMGLLIGMLAGLASIVPYLGFIVGICAALIASFFQFHDWQHIVYVIIVFSIGQMIESMVLTPLLVGDKIGLHPVAVIFAIMAGGVLFGFVGILLALPVAAVIMVLLRYALQQYLDSDLYDHATIEADT